MPCSNFTKDRLTKRLRSAARKGLNIGAAVFFGEFQDVSASRFTYINMFSYIYIYICLSCLGWLWFPKHVRDQCHSSIDQLSWCCFFWGGHSHKLCAHFKLWNPFQKQGIGQLRIIQSTLWAHHFGCRHLNRTLEMKKNRVITALMDSDRYLPEVLLFRCHGTKWRHGKTTSRKPAVSHDPMRCRGYFGKNYVIDVAFPFRPCDLWLLPLSMETSIEYLTQRGRTFCLDRLLPDCGWLEGSRNSVQTEPRHLKLQGANKSDTGGKIDHFMSMLVSNWLILADLNDAIENDPEWMYYVLYSSESYNLLPSLHWFMINNDTRFNIILDGAAGVITTTSTSAAASPFAS